MKFKLSLMQILSVYSKQASQSRTRGCISLASRTIYFGTSQYRCTVSSLSLFIYVYKIKIKIKVYHKTLPKFRINYHGFRL